MIFMLKKLIYPWLTKESLRWHIKKKTSSEGIQQQKYDLRISTHRPQPRGT